MTVGAGRGRDGATTFDSKDFSCGIAARSFSIFLGEWVRVKRGSSWASSRFTGLRLTGTFTFLGSGG
jgi:hypothetical protein